MKLKTIAVVLFAVLTFMAQTAMAKGKNVVWEHPATELKEALKDHDIVYLYLASRSPEKSWKNVIKQYHLTGENSVHYNLPVAQQSAIEHYLKVNSFPTYKLIDCEGNIHNLDWRHTHGNLKDFEKEINKYDK